MSVMVAWHCSYSTILNLGHIGFITLSRPDRKNALGEILVHELRQSIAEAKNDRLLRVLIIRSMVENCFCAGADLKERSRMSLSDVESFVDKLRETFDFLSRVDVPTIAAIDGVAVGGGLELALSCDLRYGGPNLKVGLVETKLGIIPAAGGSQRLPRLIGLPRAKEMIFTASVVTGQKAFDIGIAASTCIKYSGLIDGYHESSAFDLSMQVAVSISKNGTF